MATQEAVEFARAKYRPTCIKALFVGESPPHSGAFVYLGDTGMKRHMQKAVEEVFGKSDNFWETFKSYGWYIDDLVLAPVDHLPPAERIAMCLAGQSGLAERIKAYRPEAIVCLLRSIKSNVCTAAKTANSDAKLYSVPFPGMGHQKRFHDELIEILPQLPKL
jgi:hypothetical protein